MKIIQKSDIIIIMNKYPVLFVIFLYIFFTISSCGVILDTAKISGTWQLDYAEFYTYSKAVDSYKRYNSIADDNPTDINPVIGEFFCVTDRENFTIEFSESADKNIFKVNSIQDASTDTIIDKGEWKLNTFESSFEIYVPQNTTGSGIWARGFKSVNYWPLKELNSLEIVLKKEDVGDFSVSLSDRDINPVYMKGVFSRVTK